MKKVFFISLAFVVLHSAVTAQKAMFGFTAGAVTSNYHIKPDDNLSDLKARFGFTVGAVADLMIGKHFGLQPALNFLQKGASDEATNSGISASSKLTVNCLEIPINFLFNSNGLSNGFFAGAGPSLTYNISGKTKTTIGSNTDNSDITFGNDDGDDMKRMEIGANIVAGYRLGGGLVATLNFNAGLSDLLPGDSGDNSVRTNYFGLRIGYLFGHK